MKIEEGMQLCAKCRREKFMHKIIEFYYLNDCDGYEELKNEK